MICDLIKVLKEFRPSQKCEWTYPSHVLMIFEKIMYSSDDIWKRENHLIPTLINQLRNGTTGDWKFVENWNKITWREQMIKGCEGLQNRIQPTVISCVQNAMPR